MNDCWSVAIPRWRDRFGSSPGRIRLACGRIRPVCGPEANADVSAHAKSAR